MNTDKVYDFIAVGAGPFNLGLACLAEPIEELEGVFLDKADGFNWHPGMLLEDTTLQIPFLADLVTLADPTNPFSFLNYIKEQGKIYSFYIRESFFLLRNEYNQYCQWVTEKLSNIHFNTEVKDITYDEEQECYIVYALCTQTGYSRIFKSKKLVLGTGTVPYIPASCSDVQDSAVHSAYYLYNKAYLQDASSITVLGSGQSAAEVFYDLLKDIETYGYELNWITRSPRFTPLEYSKLTLEMTSPDYIDYFYSLPQAKKDRLAPAQKTLYKGIDDGLLEAIYDLLYTKNVTNNIKVNLRTNSELVQASYDHAGDKYSLMFHQQEENKHYRKDTDALVLGTGYTYETPQFARGIAHRIQWDQHGRFDVNRNYSIDPAGREIFVQNAELHTHGFTAPDLGMGCYRNAYIIREMTGREYYPLERRIAFQQFEVQEEEQVSSRETHLV